MATPRIALRLRALDHQQLWIAVHADTHTRTKHERDRGEAVRAVGRIDAHAGPRGERSAQSSHVGQLEQHVN